MSGPNAAAHKGYFRRKVTLACESCRRRRVKCSGSLPCSLCADSGVECTFDSKNRSRRGPRPRQPAAASGKGQPLPRLAPRPSLTDPPLVLAGVDGDDDIEDEVIVVNVPDDTDVVIPTHDIIDAASDDESDSDASGDESIVTSKDWEVHIGHLISNSTFFQGIGSTQHEHRLKLVCHLIQAFHARGIKQLRELLKPAAFLSQLTQGLLSDGLIFAICAYSSRLSVHNSVGSQDAAPNARELSKAARESLAAAGTGWKHVNDIRSICILVEYETACGNGRRAWADIGMGFSLLELAYSTASISETPELGEILGSAHNYLMQARALHSLGRPQPPLHFAIHRFPMHNLDPGLPANPTQQRVQLLTIHREIESLYSRSLSSDEPLHWVRGSKFFALQSELEKQFIQANISSNEAPSPEALGLQPEQSFAEFLQLSLIWHLCAITLNRIFLPTPSKAEGGVKEYPDAPSLFLSESRNRCDASAVAICLLARKIVNEGAFFHFPLLLGYACLSCALVLLNRLHRENEVRRKATMEHLKVTLAVLRAVGLCYQPAQHWLNIVREAHLINDSLTYASGPVSDLFISFFCRFEGLDETPMVPLDPVLDDRRSVEQGRLNEVEGAVGNDGKGSAEPRVQGNSDQALAWQQAYASHLSQFVNQTEHVADDNPEGTVGMTPCAAALSTSDEQLPDSHFSTEGTLVAGNGTDIVEAHEAGAILASLSGLGQTPHFDFDAMLNADSGGWETAGGNFDELMTFLQMPSLVDMDGMNLDMSEFV